jgi:hypothetical protein
MKTFIQENNELLKGINNATGDMARLAHRLAETSDRLQVILDQANAQIRAGHDHVSFDKWKIEVLNRPLNSGRF